MKKAVSLPASFVLLCLGLGAHGDAPPDVFSPVVGYHFHEDPELLPDRATVFSPVVGYHFHETSELLPDRATVFSPAVGYHFYEWPGDENLSFRHSPRVSYFFDDANSTWYTGRTLTPEGQPVVGASVALRRMGEVFWSGTSDDLGYFSVAGLGNDFYTLTAAKPGFHTALQNSDGRQQGLHNLHVVMRPLPAALELTEGSREASPEELGAVPKNYEAHFRVFNGTAFVFDPLLLDPNRMTVMIAHGWKSDLASWATTLAHQIHTHHGLDSGPPNIVGWDWRGDAVGFTPPIDKAVDHGILFGQALREYLGPSYSQRLHFIGHSLGTIVNRYASDHVHGSLPGGYRNPANPWRFEHTEPQATLLDEASAATIFSKELYDALHNGWQAAKVIDLINVTTDIVIAQWLSPVPSNAVWVDNYVSAVGFIRERPQVVNVSLVAKLLLPQQEYLPLNFFQFEWFKSAHGYSYQFYINSVQPAGIAPEVGFLRSAAAGAQFPPTASTLRNGTHWFENLDTPDSMDLSLSRPNLGWLWNDTFSGNVPFLYALSPPLTASHSLGTRFLSGADKAIQTVGNATVSTAQYVGNVAVATTEKISMGWDATMEKASNLLDKLNPSYLMTGIGGLSLSTMEFRLRSTPASAPMQAFGGDAEGGLAMPMGDPVPDRPPGVWLTLSVPENATHLVFDLKVFGEPHESRVVFAIQGQNVFSLPAALLEGEDPITVNPFDIRAHAGQEVEVFFGLTDVEGSDCELVLDSLRFIIRQNPMLMLDRSAQGMELRWPSNAQGWIPQFNTTLSPNGWQDFPPDRPLRLQEGVVEFPLDHPDQPMFFRLRESVEDR